MSAPTIGRIVIYRTDGRNGLVYDLPAIVSCTQASHPGDYPDESVNPLPVPSDEDSVHLTVFTPGGFGSKIDDADPDDEDFVGAPTFTPGSGTYVEWDVPRWAGDRGNPEPRTWRWPDRA